MLPHLSVIKYDKEFFIDLFEINFSETKIVYSMIIQITAVVLFKIL